MSKPLTDTQAEQVRYNALMGARDEEQSVKYEVSIRTICDCRTGARYCKAGGPVVKRNSSGSMRIPDSRIREIRVLASTGLLFKDIARQMEVSVSYVSRIACGCRRASVGGPMSELRHKTFRVKRHI